MATRRASTKPAPPVATKRRASRRSAGKETSSVSGNVLTDVDSAGVALSAEALSVRQRRAALLLGRGYSQQQAAEAVGVEARTVRRWLDTEQFEAMVQYSAQTAWERVEPGVFRVLDLANEVMAAMLRGELKADDKRVLAAERLIDRLTNRLFSVGAGVGAAEVYTPLDGSSHPQPAQLERPSRRIEGDAAG